jgi:hypothetical protein
MPDVVTWNWRPLLWLPVEAFTPLVAPLPV